MKSLADTRKRYLEFVSGQGCYRTKSQRLLLDEIYENAIECGPDFKINTTALALHYDSSDPDLDLEFDDDDYELIFYLFIGGAKKAIGSIQESQPEGQASKDSIVLRLLEIFLTRLLTQARGKEYVFAHGVECPQSRAIIWAFHEDMSLALNRSLKSVSGIPEALATIKKNQELKRVLRKKRSLDSIQDILFGSNISKREILEVWRNVQVQEVMNS